MCCVAFTFSVLCCVVLRFACGVLGCVLECCIEDICVCVVCCCVYLSRG